MGCKCNDKQKTQVAAPGDAITERVCIVKNGQYVCVDQWQNETREQAQARARSKVP
jgi:hypothetical protein